MAEPKSRTSSKPNQTEPETKAGKTAVGTQAQRSGDHNERYKRGSNMRFEVKIKRTHKRWRCFMGIYGIAGIDFVAGQPKS